MKPYEEMTFEELAALELMSVVYQCDYGILKGAIIRSTGSLCVYIGVPSRHNLSGVHYNGSSRIEGEFIKGYNVDDNINVHGGLTFSDTIDFLPDYWWFGWDYSHYGDASFYDYDPNPAVARAYQNIKAAWPDTSRKEWTVSEVKAELEKALQEMTDYIGGSDARVDNADTSN